MLQTITYTYGDSNWKDKMTAYNGAAITYDVIGNPTNDGTWTYTWEKGRQLKQMSKSGTTATFLYNADGLRIRKTVGSTVTNYTLHGKNIVHLTQGSNTLHFFYDAQNRPAIVNYNGTKYAYQYSLQGDVIGLIDTNGTQVVRYVYDAWGKVLSTTGSLASTLGTVQPFRYRGYVYDIETGLYYLRSRYYNPIWQRFVNADVLVKGNMFGYCSCSPIILSDPFGLLDVVVIGYSDDGEEELSFADAVNASNQRKDTILNDTITPGIRKYINNAEDYTYCSRGRNGNALDCVTAVNDADGKYYGSMVDAIWDGFKNKCSAWGVISDFNSLQPGDLVFSLKCPNEVKREDFIHLLEKKAWYQLAEMAKPHIGRVVTIDFNNGNGEQIAVYQSCSIKLSSKDWDAYFYNDLGPNITAPMDRYGNSNWYLFIRP